jgi:hypothetical protein
MSINAVPQTAVRTAPLIVRMFLPSHRWLQRFNTAVFVGGLKKGTPSWTRYDSAGWATGSSSRRFHNL